MTRRHASNCCPAYAPNTHIPAACVTAHCSQACHYLEEPMFQQTTGSWPLGRVFLQAAGHNITHVLQQQTSITIYKGPTHATVSLTGTLPGSDVMVKNTQHTWCGTLTRSFMLTCTNMNSGYSNRYTTRMHDKQCSHVAPAVDGCAAAHTSYLGE